MKNKMKKLAAMMLVAVALCGSALTTQAAVYRGCGHPSTTFSQEDVKEFYSTHEIIQAGGTRTCTIWKVTTKRIVRCTSCHTILHEETVGVRYEHSMSH